jgi:hypothetical protein
MSVIEKDGHSPLHIMPELMSVKALSTCCQNLAKNKYFQSQALVSLLSSAE